MSNLNPLNFPGPTFLMFYFVVAVIVNLWIRRHFRQHEARGSKPRSNMIDPYKIAFLRGGTEETIKIATFSLIDRGLLVQQEKEGGLVLGKRTLLATKNAEAINLVRRPLEQAILEKYKIPWEPSDIFTDPKVLLECEKFEEELGQMKLLADSTAFSQRIGLALFIAAVLIIGLPAAKIAVALSRGHHNVLFIIIFTVIASLFLFAAYKKRTTAFGEAFLEDQQTLFGALKRRAQRILPGGQTNEAVILASVFGFAALPSGTFPFAHKLRPRPPNSSNNSCGSSSGSSCGGGSCGGGCGGCGG